MSRASVLGATFVLMAILPALAAASTHDGAADQGPVTIPLAGDLGGFGDVPPAGTGSRDAAALSWKSPDVGGKVVDTLIVDLDGDGSLEILAVVTVTVTPPTTKLVAFSHPGHVLLWTSATYPGAHDWWQVSNMDTDAASEIAIQTVDSVTGPRRLFVIDGGTYAIQMTEPDRAR